MVKRGGKSPRNLGVKIWKYDKRTKKLLFTFLDAVILLSFSLAVYFTYFQDYTRTILFLSLGCLLLMFFIVRGILETTKVNLFK
jgi:hypothetical protein